MHKDHKSYILFTTVFFLFSCISHKYSKEHIYTGVFYIVSYNCKITKEIITEKKFKKKNGLELAILFPIFDMYFKFLNSPVETVLVTQLAHDIRMTLYGRCYDVKMLKRRRRNSDPRGSRPDLWREKWLSYIDSFKGPIKCGLMFLEKSREIRF